MIKDKLFVLGGRSRVFSDFPKVRISVKKRLAQLCQNQMVGGYQGLHYSNDPFYRSNRAEEDLRNDVWMSYDDGRSWILINPGCKDAQEDYISYGNKSILRLKV